jgi:uncharacterized protein with FMN-binding domain
MKTSRRGYAMAMLTGFAIIGASTAGVSIAQSQQRSSSADAQLPARAPAVLPSSDPAVVAAPSSPDTAATTSSASAASSTPAAAATPAAGGPTDTKPAAPAKPSRSAQIKSATSSTTATTREKSSAPIPTSSAPILKTSAPISTSSAPAAPAVHKFKDGQYSATASYNSPGGIQQIGVTVTLTADKVTAAALDLKAEGIAKTYQTLFQSGYLPQVVGKDISTISLGAVAGSSLTGGGFNTALDQIEAQARG